MRYGEVTSIGIKLIVNAHVSFTLDIMPQQNLHGI